MPTTFLSQDIAAKDPTFQNRVKMAMIHTAIAVQNEAYSGIVIPPCYLPTVQVLHQDRTRLSCGVLNAPDTYGPLFARAVAADPNGIGLGSGNPDTDLQSAVNTLWNMFASYH